MSSPIAKKNRSYSNKLLIDFHQAVSHSRRISALQYYISNEINILVDGGYISGAPRILDIGCGDLSLCQSVAEDIGASSWVGIDIHPAPMEGHPLGNKWVNYLQFDGVDIPFGENEFDVGILSDVLHHVPGSAQLKLFRSAAEKCKFVIVKDHFEYGFWSRSILRAMDFIGNHGYGVHIPTNYFTPSGFCTLCGEADVVVRSSRVGLDLYKEVPLLSRIMPKYLQFIAVCSHSS